MNRIESIDVFRLLAIIAVICIHTGPFKNVSDDNLLYVAINQGARFAVPFFFIISGYFFSRTLKSPATMGAATVTYLKRIASIWLFFSCLYLLPYDLYAAFQHGVTGPVKVIYWKFAELAKVPLDTLFEGSKVHLWFLIALGCSVLIAVTSVWVFGEKHLVPLGLVGIGLYLFALLAKPYSITPVGIDFSINTRNGPFFGTVFFVIGYALSYLNLTPKSLWVGFCVAIIGYGLQLSEVYYLYESFGVEPGSHDFVFGTLFMGLGVALMALSQHWFVSLSSLSRIGQYTLGIYAIHFVFVDMLSHIGKHWNSALWEVSYVVLVLVLSILFTLVMVRIPQLRRFFA